MAHVKTNRHTKLENMNLVGTQKQRVNTDEMIITSDVTFVHLHPSKLRIYFPTKLRTFGTGLVLYLIELDLSFKTFFEASQYLLW